MAELVVSPGFGTAYGGTPIDPGLLAAVQAAAASLGPESGIAVVELISGGGANARTDQYGNPTTDNHPKGGAIDVSLIDTSGNRLANGPVTDRKSDAYVTATIAAAPFYDAFWSAVAAQPALAGRSVVWGGTFSGTWALDTQHGGILGIGRQQNGPMGKLGSGLNVQALAGVRPGLNLAGVYRSAVNAYQTNKESLPFAHVGKMDMTGRSNLTPAAQQAYNEFIANRALDPTNPLNPSSPFSGLLNSQWAPEPPPAPPTLDDRVDNYTGLPSSRTDLGLDNSYDTGAPLAGVYDNWAPAPIDYAQGPLPADITGLMAELGVPHPLAGYSGAFNPTGSQDFPVGDLGPVGPLGGYTGAYNPTGSQEFGPLGSYGPASPLGDYTGAFDPTGSQEFGQLGSGSSSVVDNPLGDYTGTYNPTGSQDFGPLGGYSTPQGLDDAPAVASTGGGWFDIPLSFAPPSQETLDRAQQAIKDATNYAANSLAVNGAINHGVGAAFSPGAIPNALGAVGSFLGNTASNIGNWAAGLVPGGMKEALTSRALNQFEMWGTPQRTNDGSLIGKNYNGEMVLQYPSNGNIISVVTKEDGTTRTRSDPIAWDQLAAPLPSNFRDGWDTLTNLDGVPFGLGTGTYTGEFNPTGSQGFGPLGGPFDFGAFEPSTYGSGYVPGFDLGGFDPSVYGSGYNQPSWSDMGFPAPFSADIAPTFSGPYGLTGGQSNADLVGMPDYGDPALSPAAIEAGTAASGLGSYGSYGATADTGYDNPASALGGYTGAFNPTGSQEFGPLGGSIPTVSSSGTNSANTGASRSSSGISTVSAPAPVSGIPNIDRALPSSALAWGPNSFNTSLGGLGPLPSFEMTPGGVKAASVIPLVSPGWAQPTKAATVTRSIAPPPPTVARAAPTGSPASGGNVSGISTAGISAAMADFMGAHGLTGFTPGVAVDPVTGLTFDPSGGSAFGYAVDPASNLTGWDMGGYVAAVPTDVGSLSYSDAMALDPSANGGGVAAGGKAALCSHYMRRSWLPKEVWKADTRYSTTLPWDMRAGYQLWAQPLARYLGSGTMAARITERLMWPIVKAWAHEMAHRYGALPKGSLAGRLLLFTLGNLCQAIGRLERSKITKAQTPVALKALL